MIGSSIELLQLSLINHLGSPASLIGSLLLVSRYKNDTLPSITWLQTKTDPADTAVKLMVQVAKIGIEEEDNRMMEIFYLSLRICLIKPDHSTEK